MKRHGGGRRRILYLLALVGLLAPLASLIIAEARIGRQLERRVYDQWFTYRGSLPRPSDVVIVAIDEGAEESLGRFPWSRQWHAHLLRNLHRAGATVVAFDLTLPSSFPEEDAAFARALEETGIGVIGARTEIIRTPGARSVRPRLEEPAPLLRNAPIGIVDIVADAADGVIREYPVVHEFPQGRVPQLGVEVVLRHLGLPLEALQVTDAGWALGDRAIPRGPGGGMLIDFLGSAGSVSLYSYADIVDDAETDIGEWTMNIFEDYLEEGTFNGKIVLVGSTIPEHQDMHATPFRDAEGGTGAVLTPGVEIHAHAVASLLEGRHIRALPRPTQYAWTLLLALGVVALARRTRGLWGAALATGLAAASLCLAWQLFVHQGLWLWSVSPLLAIGFAYTGSNVVLYLAEEREKARIRGMFEQYVASSVVDELIEKPELLGLGGEERVLTVLFSDVVEFSSISEHLTPTQLVELLNEYLTAMTDVILDEGGIVDKYQGDAIMAEFGAPLPVPDHAVRACQAALRMRQELARLREGWRAEGKPLLEARIGVNTGKMLLGNLGSRRIMDYTVMGDQVNLAARLEGTNTLYGTDIIVSEFTWAAVRDRMVGRELDRIRVKGREEPIRIYELIAADADGLEPETDELLEDFTAALSLYVDGRFADALDAFRALADRHPYDGPTRLYAVRCEEYLTSPPPGSWDGVFTMQTK